MNRRFVLAPEAALDLVQIWRYIKKQSSVEMADHVESVIRERLAFLAANPGAGHWRKNLTEQAVKFFPVYSYLIVDRPETTPLQVVSVSSPNRSKNLSQPSYQKNAGPSQLVLAGARQSKTACLSFHRNGDGLGELKRQLTLGREGGYVLYVRLALRLSSVFGTVFGLVFRGLRHRVGFQLVGFSVEFDRSECYLHFFVLDLDDAADHFRALGNHGLSLYLDGRSELRGKGIARVVLVAGEGLAYRRADRCAFRHGDHRGCRCFAGDADSLRCCGLRCLSLRCLGFRRSGSSLVSALV